MTEAKHTPGPWECGAGNDYYVRADAYPKTFPHHFKGDDLGDYLAYVGNRTNDFGAANATLIAAAPDMLADHQENARLLALVIQDLQGRVDGSKLAALTQCLDRSRAAIAKAIAE